MTTMLRSRRLLGVREDLAAQIAIARQNLAEEVSTTADGFGDGALQALAGAAQDAKSYGAIKQLLRRQLKDAESWLAVLRELQVEIKASEARRIRHELYSPTWWKERRAALHRKFDETPDEAVALWLKTWAELLLAWELD